MKRLAWVLVMVLLLAVSAAAAEMPYREKVENPVQAIYQGPGYGYEYAGIVEEAGVYTIVEEAVDGEGRLWGRLKSGRGWIDLTDVRKGADDWVTVAYADADFLAKGGYHFFVLEESEYTVYLLFQANMPLKQVQLVSFDVAEEGLTVSRVLYTLPEWQAEVPLAAGVVFYGDMTSYGLTAVDAEGNQRCYVVSVSGYDGSLVVEECTLVAMPRMQ